MGLLEGIGLLLFLLGAAFEDAHTGLASARQDGRVPRPLEPFLCGLCAFEFPYPSFGGEGGHEDEDAGLEAGFGE